MVPSLICPYVRLRIYLPRCNMVHRAWPRPTWSDAVGTRGKQVPEQVLAITRADSAEVSPSALISCIVPVFDAQRYLAETLDSIFGQTYRPLEVIVVDDGSTDGTA